MNVILKRVLIAVCLVVVSAAVFAGVKSYGVWVISAIAVVLFVIGILRKEDKPAESGSTEETQNKDEKSGV